MELYFSIFLWAMYASPSERQVNTSLFTRILHYLASMYEACIIHLQLYSMQRASRDI